jgi:TatD DNase family protein
MEFIDTHAHLYVDDFKSDVTDVLERALQAGIKKIIMPAIDSKSHRDLMGISAKNSKFLYPLMGLHPTSVDENYKKELDIVEKHLSQSMFYGIGEIGIDLFWDKTFKNRQLEAFTTQVKWAEELKLPIVIHTRDSFDEVYKALYPLVTDNLKGIFHCFGGTVEQAKLITDMGFMIGIGGVITFKNTNLRDIVKFIDINHIVLETDSPYLAPVPFRGKRNESSYIKIIADKIAEVYGYSIDKVAEITTVNALKIFNL